MRNFHAFTFHEFLILQVELGIMDLVQTHLSRLPLPYVRDQISDDVLKSFLSDLRFSL